ncbi:hypothetical protein MD588_03070 [Photobacterium sp. SDRW27]|uniref:hypothetical protein n=1 Tax=Photobacterium obscurum TaxID=2829490 RepID=UPI002243AF5E|nr:hypothetical protein [Photobacterium obscurum]MCW8327777.1 hypothetical protein [Photobacterium obscurum]
MHNINSQVKQQPSLKNWFIKMSLPLALLSMMLLGPQANASGIATDSIANQKETVNRINAIQRDLTSIRQQTLQANPELAEQSKELEAKFQQKAEEVGYDPETFITKAQEIQEQVKDTSLSEEQRSELIKEFAAAKQKMAEQRQAIISDKELMAMQEKLQQETMVAMKAHDPKTEKLVEELNTLVETIQ